MARKKAPTEKRTHPRDPALVGILGIPDSDSGVTVNEDTSYTLSAYYCAVNIISGVMGCMPCKFYEKSKVGVDELFEHDTHRMLSLAPNPLMSAFDFNYTLQSHALTWGNGYAEIERDAAGRPTNLWLLTPDIVEPQIANLKKSEKSDLYYSVDVNESKNRLIHHQDMLHIKGLGDGFIGKSIAKLAKSTTELGLASNKYGRKFFGNSARPDGILTTDQVLKDDTLKRMQKSWDERHKGLSNAHRVAILEAGVKYTSIGLPPEDAQFLQTQKFVVVEIARWFNLPPHMLKDLEFATYSNIDNQDVAFMKYTMLPWVTRAEQEMTRKLVMPSKRFRQFVKFDFDVMLRPGMLDRFKAHQLAVLSGWKSPDEVRLSEGLNPIPDGKGQGFLTPANTVPLGSNEPDKKENVDGK